MAPRYRTHLAPSDDVRKRQNEHRVLTRKEFGQRLFNAMITKDMSQSDLARAADIGRDSVSNYVRGISLPNPTTLERLAKVLGLQPVDLLPNYDARAIAAEESPSLEIKTSATDESRTWVRLNREISTGAALKILQVVNEDVLPAAKRK